MSDLVPPQKEETGAPLVELLNFSKRFGSFQALKDVSLTVRAGTFHALLGENGAGKSTLVKALIGFHAADTGSTTIDGRERRIDNQRDAARLGIGMIFQHFTVAPGMTVAENLTLADRELSALIDWKRERARLAAFMKTAPFPLPLDRMVAGLSAGEKQKLEILKQLYTKRRFLILDEPTSVLTPQEADEVLGRLKAMAQAGEISVLMITHKFREVFGVCDDVTVLRRGRLTGQGRVDAVDRDKLAAWMMGADIAPAAKVEASLEAGVAAPAPSVSVTDTMPRLRVVGIRVESDTPGLPAIHDLSLEVRPGEIVGIAGVSGNGQSELMAALTGVLPMTAGHLTVDGYPYRPQRESMRRLRIASLPEEPLHNGCVGRMSVEENLAFRNFDCPPLTESARAPGRWWLSHRRMRAQALERIAGFKVKTTGPQAPMASLSGGNVQRAVLARELSQTPRLLIVANPCFGLDFQAASEIHGRLRDARDAGCAVLLISEDLDELLALSTRLLVLSHGHIAYETALTAVAGVAPPPVDIAAIGRAMAGDSHAAAEALAA
jgi:general nucleoside transport system ATP-binding protein